MAIELTPLPLPASADPSKFVDFGREVKGVNPGDLTPDQFAEIYDALYKVSCNLSLNLPMSPCNLNPPHHPTSTALSFSAMSLSLRNNSMH